MNVNEKYSELEGLRRKVIEKGQKKKERRKIEDVLYLDKISEASDELLSQISRDTEARYKFYDALAMWLGQADNGLFSEEDNEILKKIANDYLKT